MKKRNLLLVFASLATCAALACVSLTGCDAIKGVLDKLNPSEFSSESAPEEIVMSEVKASYITSDINTQTAYGSGSWIATAYHLNLFENGAYEYVTTSVTYGYSMNLSTSAVVLYGQYEEGAAEDGAQAITLKEASQVLVNAYSKAGGFHISIDSEKSTYPVEMPAKVQGEKNMAESKEDVIKEYGAGRTLYVYTEDNNEISFTNPNDPDAAAPVVTAKSEPVTGIYKTPVESVAITSNINTETAYGKGAWIASATMMILTEDNAYECVTTSVTYGFSMNLSTESTVTYGTAVLGVPEDGSRSVTMQRATKVLENSFSKAGGFHISINSETSSYPVEMPAKVQGEKNMANSKEDVINNYGLEKVVYVYTEDNNEISLTNPNE